MQGREMAVGGDWVTTAKRVVAVEQLEQIYAALAPDGIEPIVLKGVGFWADLYAAGERSVSDIDILVSKRETARLHGVLMQLGYRLRTLYENRPATLRNFYERLYDPPNKQQQLRLELHSNLCHPERYRMDPEVLLARSVEVELDGLKIRRLCTEDTLLHLAIHRTLHDSGFSDDVRNVDDAARIVSRLEPDWPATLERARAWGCATALWLLLDSARGRFGAPVSEQVLRGLRPGILRRQFLQSVLRRDDGLWLFRWPGMGRARRRALLYPLVIDRPQQHVRAAGRFARLRAQDVLESKFRS